MSDSTQFKTLCDIEKLVAESKQIFENLKSPHELHRERVAVVENELHDLCRTYQEGSEEERKQKFLLIAELGGKLSELSNEYNANKEEQDRVHRKQLDNVLNTFVHNVLGAFGPTLVNEGQRSMNEQLLSPEPCATSRPISPPQFDMQSGIVCGGNADESINVKNSVQKNHGGDPEAQDTIHIPNKRKTVDDADEADSSARSKRPRTSSSKPTVRFDEVYQDGKAPKKHVIVQFPKGTDAWYIIRCAEHNMTFKKYPLLEAGNHLKSAHRHHSKASSFAVELLGVEVLECNRKLAKMNNAVAMKSFAKATVGEAPSEVPNEPVDECESEEEAWITELRNKSLQPSRQPTPTRSSRRHKPETDPIPGEVYRAYWGKANEWMPVLLLPFRDLHEIGIPGSLETYGLTDSIPKGLVYDRSIKEFNWEPEYQDSGPSADKRQFPVLFFNEVWDDEFPNKSDAAWVSAENLQYFDFQNCNPKLVRHYQSVRDYYMKRQQQQQRSTRRAIEPSNHGQSSPRNAVAG